MKIWEPKAPGTLWATPGLLGDCITFTFYVHDMIRKAMGKKWLWNLTHLSEGINGKPKYQN
jgi:hypothetical protein